MKTIDDGATAPSTVPWPPLVFGVAAVAAVGLGRALPLRRRLPLGVRMLGAAALAAGLAFDVAAMATMRRHRANILPHRPATALVTSGPFALTRNPIYLGNTLALAGAGLLSSNPWLPVGAALAARAVADLAIVPEERHMAARFGEDWVAYERRVPRWLGVLHRRRPTINTSFTDTGSRDRARLALDRQDRRATDARRTRMGGAARVKVAVVSLGTVLALGPQAWASPPSPWMTGRWSSDGCADPSSPGTRFFGPDRTRSKDDDCRIALTPGPDGSHRAHLTCHYPGAQADTADVVLDVRSPTVVDWVNECVKVTYRYCGR